MLQIYDVMLYTFKYQLIYLVFVHFKVLYMMREELLFNSHDRMIDVKIMNGCY